MQRKDLEIIKADSVCFFNWNDKYQKPFVAKVRKQKNLANNTIFTILSLSSTSTDGF